MTLSEAKKQTVLLTFINGVVRALGLGMRVILSRMAGAEVMGVMELAQSVHMVAIAPVTSGLPAAVTRLTAKAAPDGKMLPLQAGLWLTRCVSFIAIPLLWFLSPVIAKCMGDFRVMPSLWFSAPCVLVLGYSACLNGYCYGCGKTLIPAISELIEQLVRVSLTLALIAWLRHLTAGWTAAIPSAATFAAEAIGLMYAMHAIKQTDMNVEQSVPFRRQLWNLSYPATLNRMIQTLLRSLTAILIPLRLQQSGLSAAEATSRLGMLNGMVMPILMLPCIFTSAVSMVALPKMAYNENQPRIFWRLIGKCMWGACGFSLVCAFFILLEADTIAIHLYRLPEIGTLFRNCAFLTVLTASGHILGTALSALGEQNWLLRISCITSIATLVLTWILAASPALRIQGVIISQMAGSVLSVLLCVCRLSNVFKSDDKSV